MRWLRGTAQEGSESSPTDSAQPDRHVDIFVESYVQWREECDALESAYQRSAESTPAERDLAFSVYRAALDREEEAASVYSKISAELDGRVRA